MSLELEWSKDFPKELRALVEPLVLKHAKRLPSWIQTLRIDCEDLDPEVIASIAVSLSYRQASLNVDPIFLNETHRNRERAIIHEFMHGPLGPIQDWVVHVINSFIPEDLRQIYYKAYMEVEEGAVQDITFAIHPPKVT